MNITPGVVSGHEELYIAPHGFRYLRLVVTATKRAWPGLRTSAISIVLGIGEQNSDSGSGSRRVAIERLGATR